MKEPAFRTQDIFNREVTLKVTPLELGFLRALWLAVRSMADVMENEALWLAVSSMADVMENEKATQAEWDTLEKNYNTLANFDRNTAMAVYQKLRQADSL